MRNYEHCHPRARRNRLIVRELPDEVLIYDQDRDKAHCLNNSAATIWKLCDGNTSPAQIARSLQGQSGLFDERVVWLALEQFSRDHLLEDRLEWPATLPRLSRRDAVRMIGLGAAIAIPLVTSIIAPTPAQAATCLTHCTPCGTGSQCCSGVCSSSVPGCAGMRCV